MENKQLAFFSRAPRGAKFTVNNTLTPVEKVYRSSLSFVEKRRIIEKGGGNKFLCLASFPSPNIVYTPFRSESQGGVCKVFTRHSIPLILNTRQTKHETEKLKVNPRSLRRGFTFYFVVECECL